MEIFIVQALWLRAIDFTSSNTGHKRMGLMKTSYFSMKVVSNSRTWEYSKLHAESLACRKPCMQKALHSKQSRATTVEWGSLTPSLTPSLIARSCTLSLIPRLFIGLGMRLVERPLWKASVQFFFSQSKTVEFSRADNGNTHKRSIETAERCRLS